MLNTCPVLFLLVYSLLKQGCCISLSILTFTKISGTLLVACVSVNILILSLCVVLTCKCINRIYLDAV